MSDDSAEIILSVSVECASHKDGVVVLHDVCERLATALPHSTVAPLDVAFGADARGGDGSGDDGVIDFERSLNIALLDLYGHLVDAKKNVAVAIADEKRLLKQAEQERQLTDEWKKRVKLCVDGGNAELAAQAQLRVDEHAKLGDDYERAHAEQKRAVDKLKSALATLNGRIEDAKREKNMLVARAKRAEAQQHIAAATTAIETRDVDAQIARLAEHVAAVEARVDQRPHLVVVPAPIDVAPTTTAEPPAAATAPPTPPPPATTTAPPAEVTLVTAAPTATTVIAAPAASTVEAGPSQALQAAQAASAQALQATLAQANTRVEIRVTVACETSELWHRAQRVADVEDALRAFVDEQRARNPMVTLVVKERPRIGVGPVASSVDVDVDRDAEGGGGVETKTAATSST